MVKQDLFLNAKERLWEWLKQKKWAKTSEIIYWGVTEGYSNRAARNARILAKEGKIRRMKPDKKALRFPNCREEIWEVIPWTETPVTRLGSYIR